MRRRLPTHVRFFVIVACLALGFPGIWFLPEGACDIWSDSKIRSLPDSSFIEIETREDGSRIRHCPYRDINGQIDGEQLIYSLGTISEEKWIDPQKGKIAGEQLESHYQMLLSEWVKEGLQDLVNINTAPLSRLVTLPRIGPVLAVRIYKSREEHGKFETIESITRVDGIGRGTLNAIRHYIRVN